MTIDTYVRALAPDRGYPVGSIASKRSKLCSKDPHTALLVRAKSHLRYTYVQQIRIMRINVRACVEEKTISSKSLMINLLIQ